LSLAENHLLKHGHRLLHLHFETKGVKEPDNLRLKESNICTLTNKDAIIPIV